MESGHERPLVFAVSGSYARPRGGRPVAVEPVERKVRAMFSGQARRGRSVRVNARARTVGLLAAAAVLLALSAAALAVVAPSARAVSGCTGTTTVTCTYSGAGSYTFTVPPGVSSLDVTAVGAAGGAGALSGGSGG